MSIEVACGNVKEQSVRFVADRVAKAVIAAPHPRAVTVDPTGKVWVETPASACEYDLLGVYDGTLGSEGLSEVLQDELSAELARRKWRNKVETRRAAKVLPKAA